MSVVILYRSPKEIIRDTARAADLMPPTERVQRIALIFSHFHNPDKETVLTPWRVVNMHMSDCLGGYKFLADDNETELSEPVLVDHGEVTTSVFADPDTHILEINSKTGLYPLYMAYTTYRYARQRFIDKHTLARDLTREEEQAIWDEVVSRNIFVICKTKMARSITRRTLIGFRDKVSTNLHAYDDLLNQVQNKKAQFIKSVCSLSFWNYKYVKSNDMLKFNAIVGNPPYQETTVGTSDKPVYHLFMDVAFSLSPRVTLITPARYLFNAGKTPREWNNRILNDEHFRVVWYKANSTDVFPNVDIKGGVAVMYRDTTQNFGKIGSYTAYSELNGIYTKVVENESFSPLSDIIYAQIKFDLDGLYKEHPELKKLIGSDGREKRLTTSIFSLDNILTDKPSGSTDIKILELVSNNREWRYIKRKYLEDHPNLKNIRCWCRRATAPGR